MSDNADYLLTKRLDGLVKDTEKAASRAVDDAEREASRIGRTGSAYSQNLKNEALRKHLREAIMQTAQIVSRASHLDDDAKLNRMAATGYQLYDQLAGVARRDFPSRGPGDQEPFNRLDADLKAILNRDIESMLHDFPTGFLWGQSFGPVQPAPPSSQVTIGAIHGGHQQIAAGGIVNQTMAVNQSLRDLVTAIRSVQALEEFAALDEGTRRELGEAALDLEEEATRPTPEPARLTRWGERFMTRLRGAGLLAAEEMIKTAFLHALIALVTSGVAH